MKNWKIGGSDAGKRLDIFLTEQGAGSTRSAIQKAMKAGHVTVNGKVAAVHRFLTSGDHVEWHAVKRAVAKTRRTGLTLPSRASTAEKPRVIAETEDWLVIDKPSGLLAHPTMTSTEPTLVDWLIAHDPKIGRVGEDPSRPGIVHRLDREVSGLMVIAKTSAAFDGLKRQFARHSVRKVYRALVHGSVREDEGDIKFRIARSTSQARMAARPQNAAGKAAWTHYRTLERKPRLSLLELEILSGRTHQIRAHLYALGHPVVGDPLYRRKTGAVFTAPRVMLQSIGLAFDDPSNGERRTFALEPDPSFARLMRERTKP